MKGFLDVKACFRAAAIVLIGVLAAGCATGGYDAGSLHDRLVDAGLRSTQATCVVRAMVRQFGATRLAARAEPIADEVDAERALLSGCGVETGR